MTEKRFTHPLSKAAVEAAATAAYNARYNHEHSPRTEIEWRTEPEAIKNEWRYLARFAISAAFEQAKLEGNAREGNVSKGAHGEWVAFEGSGNTHQDFPVTIIRNAKP